MVTVNIDPLGAVSVTADVTVQGQHETVCCRRIVRRSTGLQPGDVDVTLEMDTAKDQWSIAAGTYSCASRRDRRGGAYGGGATGRKLKGIAAKRSMSWPTTSSFSGGQRSKARHPDTHCRSPRRRHLALVAGDAAEGMAPGAERDRALESARIGTASSDRPHHTSLTYGFVFDMCGIEIDPLSPIRSRSTRYVSMHDAGKILNPLIARVRCAAPSRKGLRSALRGVRHQRGRRFLTGTFADYWCRP